MPLYDAKCNACNEIEEIFIGIDDDIPVCPKCESKRTRLCNCTHFKLVYNSKTDTCAWGNENYNSTQRYRYTGKGNVDE